MQDCWRFWKLFLLKFYFLCIYRIFWNFEYFALLQSVVWFPFVSILLLSLTWWSADLLFGRFCMSVRCLWIPSLTGFARWGSAQFPSIINTIRAFAAVKLIRACKVRDNVRGRVDVGRGRWFWKILVKITAWLRTFSVKFFFSYHPCYHTYTNPTKRSFPLLSKLIMK